jgi:AAA family ATP:ADP antiporter
LPRPRFIAFTYRFFIANLIGFYLLFQFADSMQSVWVGRVFFIWISVFNLFVVSVFWSFMTDIYHPEQSKRLFGVIAVGGTLGALLGSTITTAMVDMLGPIHLLLVSALFLELAARSAWILGRQEPQLLLMAGRRANAQQVQTESDVEHVRQALNPTDNRVTGRVRTVASENAELEGERSRNAKSDAVSHDAEVIGGGVIDGVTHVFKSPYLLGIAGLMLFFTIASTFLYFQRIDIVSREFADDAIGRVRLFGAIDVATNVLTLATQLFLTGRLLRWFGLGFGLAFLPVVSLIGFGVLGAAPVLAVVVVFEVCRRAGNFAVARPSREVLYTVLSRSDKYKAKNFNDTFVYRLGDQMGSWSYTVMAWLGLTLSGLALTMVPLSLAWLLLALWLGRAYTRGQKTDSHTLRQ